MKYQIKEEGGWFYPQLKRSFLWPWRAMRGWDGVCNCHRFRTMDEAKRVIDIDAGARQRIAMDKANVKYHPYP